MSCGKSMENRRRETLKIWAKRARRGARAHYLRSEDCLRKGKKITVLNAISSISVLFFANAQWVESVVDNKLFFTSAVSVSSLVLVILAILQYLNRYEEKAEFHKCAGVQFANLMRKIERYLCKEDIEMEAIHNISKSYNQITSSFPLVPISIWKKKHSDNLETEIIEDEHDLFGSDVENFGDDINPSTV